MRPRELIVQIAVRRLDLLRFASEMLCEPLNPHTRRTLARIPHAALGIHVFREVRLSHERPYRFEQPISAYTNSG